MRFPVSALPAQRFLLSVSWFFRLRERPVYCLLQECRIRRYQRVCRADLYPSTRAPYLSLPGRSLRATARRPLAPCPSAWSSGPARAAVRFVPLPDPWHSALDWSNPPVRSERLFPFWEAFAQWNVFRPASSFLRSIVGLWGQIAKQGSAQGSLVAAIAIASNRRNLTVTISHWQCFWLCPTAHKSRLHVRAMSVSALQKRSDPFIMIAHVKNGGTS